MLWIPLVIGAAVVLTTLQARMREDYPEWAVLVAIGFVVTVVLGLLPRFGEAVDVLTGLAREANVSSMYLTPVLKTIGIAYVTSFGVQICNEAGEESIASVVALAGKIVILFVALPLVQAILYALLGILD